MKKYILVCVVSTCVALSTIAQVNYKWVKSIGGENNDIGTSVATDGAGNVYVTANIEAAVGSNVNFDPYGSTSSAITLTSGNYCAFAKYDVEGNCLWKKSFICSDGVSNYNFLINRIIVGAGDTAIYVAGGYVDTVDFGGIELNNASVETPKPFLAKYRASDGVLLWATDLELTEGLLTDIAVHPYYPMYVFFSGTTGEEALFGKCDVANGDTLYVKQIAGSGIAVPLGIALDYNAKITITGFFSGTVDFNPDVNLDSSITSSYNSRDIFIAQYYLGGDFIWAKSFGGNGDDEGTAIAFNSMGDTIYLAGSIQDGAFGNLVVGYKDAFIAKLDNTGNLVNPIKRVEATNTNDSVICSSIFVDASDNVYITGFFKGEARFIGIGSNDTIQSNGDVDIFFAKYNAGLEYGWSVSVGGTSTDRALDIAVDANSNIYLTGSFKDTVDFNPAAGVANRIATPSNFTSSDIFFAKYTQGTGKIKGHVTYGTNNTILNGTNGTGNSVRLYTQIQFDGNQAMNLVAETSINNVGYYEFNNVPDGEYLALAVVGDNYSDSIVNTYHRVPGPYQDSAVFWEGATPILPLSTAPASVADIRMIAITPVNGNAALSGQIIFGPGFDRANGSLGVGVSVRKPPSNAILAHTETDVDGNYSFSNLPADTCYKLYVNIVGLPMISNYSPCPGEYDSIPHLDFYVDSVYIDTVPNIPNSISQINAEKMSVTLYPNPNTGTATIEFTLTQTQTVNVEVYNLLGKKETVLLNETKQAGTVQYKYNIAEKGMKAGIYLLQIKIGDEVITKKMIVVD